MIYKVAERFRSVQGEGLYTGTPMAFIRFVGCSVGKKVCSHCDTDFDSSLNWRGGGEYSPRDLLDWAIPFRHICLTGGEPLNQDLIPLFEHHGRVDMFHVETSGTIKLQDLTNMPREKIWYCVSPKPGFLEEVVLSADEVKVIVPGLGSQESLDKLRSDALKQGRSWHPLAFDSKEFRWPTLEDAFRWSDAGKLVFLQPRNAKFDVDSQNLLYVQDLIREYPQLRLSVQLHKVLKVQ